MGSFSEEDFIESLNQYGCSVHFKGKTSYNRHRTAESFYRKFIRSPGFFTWLEMKMRLQTDSLSLSIDSLASLDLASDQEEETEDDIIMKGVESIRSFHAQARASQTALQTVQGQTVQTMQVQTTPQTEREQVDQNKLVKVQEVLGVDQGIRIVADEEMGGTGKEG
jgi:hypothetical protein